jgi:uncharacterized damage-inducible protein DinB
MEESDRYKVLPVEGYTPGIGVVVRMMDLVRSRTLRAVEGLTTEQIDYLHDTESNSIGALLAHMAAVEVVHSIRSFEDRAPTADEWERLKTPLGLGEAARREIRGKLLEYYLDELTAVRERTKAQLRTKDDAWLLEERDYVDGQRANNYYIWFHVPEDETNHRGQISWLRKRLSA